jgi:DNA-binding transcriptional LysR family regulator
MNSSSAVTLKHLRVFARVAEAGSFTRAAQRLHQTQSSTTVLVRQLEQALGLKLFARTTRQVTLTGAGREFLPTALRLTREFETALRDMRDFAGMLRGQLCVAAGPSVAVLLLPALLRAFGERYPGVRIKVVDDTSGDIQRRVLSGEADLGLTSRHREEPELVFEPVLHDVYGIICGADHALARKQGPIRWDALGKERFVGLSDETGIGAFLRALPNMPDPVRAPFYEAHTTTSQAALVAAGLGIGVLPALAAARAPISTLRFRPLAGPRIEREICIITHRSRPQSPAAQAFTDQMRDALRTMKLPAGVRRSRASNNG